MHKFFLLPFIFLFLCAMDFSDEENNRRTTRENNSFEDLSEYSSETIENANAAFFHGENGEFDQLEKPLKYAAEKRYRYALPQYAHWLLGETHLLSSKTPIDDIYRACDCLLMAAHRGEESAVEYIQKLEPQAKQINAKEGENYGVMDILHQEEHTNRKKWLKGEYAVYTLFPPTLRKATDLLFLCILPEIDGEIFEKFNHTLRARVQELTKKKNDALKGRNAVSFHRYATETLKLPTSSAKKDYSGSSQSETGDGKYAYCNTRAKYPYCLDVAVRTWDKGLEKGFLPEGDPRFVQTNAIPMAAGPVYIRGKKKPSGTKVNLSPSTAFIVEEFYKFFVPFFQHRPLWLVEITHMDEPWRVASQKVQNDYNGKWPDIRSQEGHGVNPEWEKRDDLKKLFKARLTQFITGGESKKSISYRLFMIGIINKIKNSSQDKEDHFETSSSNLRETKEDEDFSENASSSFSSTMNEQEISIDFSQTTKEELESKRESVKNATVVTLYNITIKNQNWLETEIREGKCRTLQYSRKPSTKGKVQRPLKQFEKLIGTLKNNGVTVIESPTHLNECAPEKKE